MREKVELKDVTLDFDIQRQLARRQQCLALPLGTRPSNPQQNAQLGAPFAYDPTLDSESDAARIHQDLTKRGYFVVNALRHGFDFVVYEGDPARHHGSHFVIVTSGDKDISPRQLVLWHRLAASGHKSIILASAAKGSPVRYWMISGEER
eukprot:symbB.v1.2.010174.t1/scaffold651.1/size176249/4